MEECISAISTARGASGVAIIRLSGLNSLEIAKKMFHSKTAVKDFEPYKLYVGTIDCQSFKDFGMCVYFKAPKSYTGEDMVEFHCHGGTAITEGVLRRTIELGARLATNGEYTKRAFLNGKLSLSSAEGLIDMINAESEMEARCGYYLYREKLLKKITAQQDTLLNILAQIDVDIDYPEEDVPSCDKNVIKNRLEKVNVELKSLIESYKGASKVKNGIKVAIVGRPNAGKSSLLNSILKCEKAIVTSVAGTTRDIVEGSVDIDGVKFLFYDTAGIHESQDMVEKIGIERSLKTIESADLVIHIVDSEFGFLPEDDEIQQKLSKINSLTILNKLDLHDILDKRFDLKISATNGDGIENLKKLIFEKTVDKGFSADGDFVTETRHFNALVDAYNAIQKAIDCIGMMPLDIITIDIRDGWNKLGFISGSTCEQAVVDEIFAKFCVGK